MSDENPTYLDLLTMDVDPNGWTKNRSVAMGDAIHAYVERYGELPGAVYVRDTFTETGWDMVVTTERPEQGPYEVYSLPECTWVRVDP